MRCIGERRGIELIDTGEATTPVMAFGDTILMEAGMPEGGSVFGAIRQRVVRAAASR